jgi:hypothetical protein
MSVTFSTLLNTAATITTALQIALFPKIANSACLMKTSKTKRKWCWNYYLQGWISVLFSVRQQGTWLAWKCVCGWPWRWSMVTIRHSDVTINRPYAVHVRAVIAHKFHNVCDSRGADTWVDRRDLEMLSHFFGYTPANRDLTAWDPVSTFPHLTDATSHVSKPCCRPFVFVRSSCHSNNYEFNKRPLRGTTCPSVTCDSREIGLMLSGLRYIEGVTPDVEIVLAHVTC